MVTNKLDPTAPIAAITRQRTQSQLDRYRHLAPRLKAFQGDPKDALDRALLCGEEIKARIGIHLWQKGAGERNVLAEARLKDRGFDILATATTSNPTSAGYTVPTPLSAAVAEIRDKVGVSRLLATVLPMSAGTMSVPKETSGYTIYCPAEGSAITPSDLSFGSINLDVRSRHALGYITHVLEGDSLIAFTDVAVRRMAFAHAAHEDNCLINGNGTSTYDNEVGLLAALGSAGVATAATGNDTWQELTVKDHAAAMGKLPARYSGGMLAWLCSHQYYAIAMLGSTGGAAQGFTPDGRPLYLGYPVYLSSKMPTATAASTVGCLFGNFEEAVTIGDRTSFEFSVSEHFLFDRDLLALKGTTRFDINCHELGDASAAGAVVGLATAS